MKLIMHINVCIRKWDGRIPVCLIFQKSKRKLNVKMKEIRWFCFRPYSLKSCSGSFPGSGLLGTQPIKEFRKASVSCLGFLMLWEKLKDGWIVFKTTYTVTCVHVGCEYVCYIFKITLKILMLKYLYCLISKITLEDRCLSFYFKKLKSQEEDHQVNCPKLNS